MSVQAVYAVAAGACARQAQEPGRRVFLRKRVGEAPGAYERQIRKDRTRSYMNGNGELTETENVIFT